MRKFFKFLKNINLFKLNYLIIPLLLLIFLYVVYYWSSANRRLPNLKSSEINTAIRGKIVTSDNYISANSQKLYKVSVDSRSIDPNKLELFVKLYCIYTGDNEKRVKDAITSSKGTIVLSYKIDAKMAVHLKELARKLNLKKVFVSFLTPSGKSNPPIRMSVSQSGEKRVYNTADSLTPLIGYINKTEVDGITRVKGIKGIEKYYEYYLNPINDEKISGLRDIGDNIILEKSSRKSSKIDGYDAILNINLKVQKELEFLADNAADDYDAKEILIAVMDSKSGKILALATNLRYNPGNITKKTFSNLNSTASEYAYEMGSVIKPIIFSIAYETGMVRPDEMIPTYNGSYKLGSRTIKDTHPANEMSATDIIVHSSNIGMIMISSRLSGEILHSGLEKFGFMQKTGIDLPYEQKGYMPDVFSLENKVYKATTSYGYGLQLTFLQLLNAYMIFNNDGVIISPRIVSYLRKNGEFYQVNEAESRNVISSETANVLKEILIQTVERGTGRKGQVEGLQIGGKTGTARIASGGGYSNLYNSSFFGFANDKSSSFTIGVLVREPKKGSYYAAQNALPTFRKTVEILVNNGYLHPSITDKNRVIIKDENEIIKD